VGLRDRPRLTSRRLPPPPVAALPSQRHVVGGGASYNPWMESRYDAYAQWYAEFTRDWSPSCLPYLPSDLHGQHVLDLACGVGRLSTSIADRGATVTAVDASAPMLDQAAPAEGVDYRQGDATTTDWWDGRPFDGVVSNMALMDIEVPHRLVAVQYPARGLTIRDPAIDDKVSID